MSDDQLRHKLIWDDAFSIDVAARYLRSLIDKHNLDTNANDTDYKAFIAYAASPEVIESLNSHGWQFTQLRNEAQAGSLPSKISVGTIDTLISRARKYEYWTEQLRLLREVGGLFREPRGILV